MKLVNHNKLEGTTAILGGSFDPVHLGHLHIADQILVWSGVSEILFVPNGNHHFKKGQVRLSYSERYALVQDAIKGKPRFSISQVDKDGSGYTADFLRQLYSDNPDTNYVFIIGSDNLANLQNWYDYPWLKQHVHFLVIQRPGYNIDLEIITELRVSLLPIELSPISSTEIRNRISSGQSIRSMVPEHLEQRIIKLYSSLKSK